MSIGRTSRSSHSGPSVRMVPARRRTRTAVIFMPSLPDNPRTIAPGPETGEQGDWRAAGSVLGCECLGGSQLRLVHHPLVAVLRVLRPVEEVAAFDGEQTLDRVKSGGDMPFQPVRNEMDCLTDLEPMLRHGGPRKVRR